MIDFHDSFRNRRTLIIGHRGAPRVHHENTLESFEAAIRIGADAVEFDVRRTADEVIVVFHDPHISPGRRLLKTLSYKELDYRAAQQGYHVPTLSEALDFCSGKISLDIELKEAGYEDEVLSLVNRFYQPSHAVLKSFHASSVTALKDSGSEFPIGLLVGLPAPRILMKKPVKLRVLKRLDETGADFISPHWRLVRRRFLRRMSRRGTPVIVWTVDSKRISRFLLKQRVAGIVSNRPEKILALQASLKKQ